MYLHSIYEEAAANEARQLLGSDWKEPSYWIPSTQYADRNGGYLPKSKDGAILVVPMYQIYDWCDEHIKYSIKVFTTPYIYDSEELKGTIYYRFEFHIINFKSDSDFILFRMKW